MEANYCEGGGGGTKLRAELSSVVLPFNSWYDTEEREGGQCRGIKHERDEERFDRLPRSVTPRGTCPDHVSRWQVLCVCAHAAIQQSVTSVQCRQL